MGPEDIRWQDNDSGIDPMAYLRSRAAPGNGGRKSTSRSGLMPGPGRGRGFQKTTSKKDFPSPQNGVGKRSSDDIDILHTESLIKEVIVNSIDIHDYKKLAQTLRICFY
jgi:hypothetical protein